MTTSRSKKATSKKVSTPRRQSTALAKADAAFTSELVRDFSALIEAAQRQVATVANAALTALHWQVGHRVHTAVLDGKRAEAGAQIVATVSRQLAERYDRGFNEKSLPRMARLATAFPEREFVATASRQLSWSDFIKKELSTLRESGELTPDLVMRDPYMLDLLGLADTYSEKDPVGRDLRGPLA